MLDYTVDLLPADQPRYLMGVGTPTDLVNTVWMGIDMFDCIMPTRNGRNGMAALTHAPLGRGWPGPRAGPARSRVASARGLRAGEPSGGGGAGGSAGAQGA